jgi:hypothetical protein
MGERERERMENEYENMLVNVVGQQKGMLQITWKLLSKYAFHPYHCLVFYLSVYN